MSEASISGINTLIGEVTLSSVAPSTLCGYEKVSTTKNRALVGPFWHPNL